MQGLAVCGAAHAMGTGMYVLYELRYHEIQSNCTYVGSSYFVLVSNIIKQCYIPTSQSPASTAIHLPDPFLKIDCSVCNAQGSLKTYIKLTVAWYVCKLTQTRIPYRHMVVWLAEGHWMES